jgi:hypothetical protein
MRSATRTGYHGARIYPGRTGRCSPAWSPVRWRCCWRCPRSRSTASLSSVIGNACWNRASRLLPLTMIGQMIVFETVFALLYGFVWEARLPDLLESLAIACLLSGVLWCARAHAVRPANA